MLEPHAPYEPIHNWKGFFIHIATNVVGLMIAVLLEQTVEYIHHRHQRLALEEQMTAVMYGNLELDTSNFKQLSGLRQALLELLLAIDARRRGDSIARQPPVDDRRLAVFLRYPSLAPYEAAQQNGTIALLPVDRLRIYKRVAFARELLFTARDRWFQGADSFEGFRAPAARSKSSSRGRVNSSG